MKGLYRAIQFSTQSQWNKAQSDILSYFTTILQTTTI